METFIKFSPCYQKTYNCVSSVSHKYDSYHYIFPIEYHDKNRHPFTEVLKILRDMECCLVTLEENYIHATYTSFFNYVYDIELEYKRDQNIINIKSASRQGYWDFGINRRRMDKIRNLLTNYKLYIKS